MLPRHADIATVVIAASVLDVADFLRRPGNIHRYLTGALSGAAALHQRPELLGSRWEFQADPAGRLFRWWLLAPYGAEGTLEVHGDSRISQVWVSVNVAPPGAQVHDTARAVLHRLRLCIETTSAARPSPRQDSPPGLSTPATSRKEVPRCAKGRSSTTRPTRRSLIVASDTSGPTR